MTDRIEKLKAFLKDSPDDCFLNHALALEYVKMQNDAAARSLFEKNMATDTSYVATYYHLGKLLERADDQQAAVGIYKQGMLVAKEMNDMHSYNELQGAYENLAY